MNQLARESSEYGEAVLGAWTLTWREFKDGWGCSGQNVLS